MPPHIAEMNEFYARLHVANPKAAILSIIPGYSETFNMQQFIIATNYAGFCKTRIHGFRICRSPK